MLTSEEVRTLVSLRAKGHSYQKIAQEMKRSKQTLINAAKKYSSEIEELKSIELDGLQREFLVAKEERIKALGKLCKRLLEEVDKRDLSTISTEKLIQIATRTMTMLEAEQTPAIVREAKDSWHIETRAQIEI